MHLKNAGHVCLYDRQGERAVTLAQEHKMDLVIAEVMLPDVCGFEVCRRIRAHPELFTLPIILMSTMCEEEEIRHGYAQGADEYLVKPFEPHHLIGHVAAQLQVASLVAQLDPITHLINQKKFKVALQRHINLKARFALVYIELISLTPFAREVGTEKRDKALRHLARLIERYGDRLASEAFCAAHMGGGHFVCLLEPQHADTFCKGVLNGWTKHLPEFHDAIGFNPDASQNHGVALLSLMLCVTDSISSGARSAQEYFDVLVQLRKKAIASGNGGIYHDHRKSL